jgi:hypothetical protein
MVIYAAVEIPSAWFVDQCEQLGVQLNIIEPPKDGLLQLDEIKKADISIGAIVADDESDFSLIEIFLTENSSFHKHMNPFIRRRDHYK